MKRICADINLFPKRAPSTTPTLSEVQEDDSSEHILNLNQLVISDSDEDINGEQGNSTLQSLQQSPDSGLWENDLLRSLNLAINTDLRIFVCRLCEKGFINKKPGCIVKHMRKHTSITQDIVAGLRKLADQFKINDFPNLASTNPPTLRQQKGFTILYMFGCPICPTAGTRKFMNDHFRESHPHIYPAATPVPNIPCHAFTFGKPRHYVRIIPDTVTAPPTTEDTITTALLEFSVRDKTQDQVPDARMISPWLNRAKWPVYVKGYPVQDLKEMVRMPSATDALAWVQPLVTAYMEHASNSMLTTHEQILRKLNTPNPAKTQVCHNHVLEITYSRNISSGLNHTPLHPLQEASSMRAYVRPVALLIITLYRCKRNGYQLPVNNRLQATLVSLAKDKTTRSLHEVFLALWTTEWTVYNSSSVADPSLGFLALLHLKADGDFSKPQNVTPDIAKLCRAIQLCMLVQYQRYVEEHSLKSKEAVDKVTDFVQEDKFTTFSSLMSLQHYASAIAFQTTSFPRIVWPQRAKQDWLEMIYEGHPISIANIKTMLQSMEERAADIWANKVMLGSGLNVTYNTLVDKLTSTKAGYSFLEDNQFPGHFNDFGKYVLSHPTLRKRFVKDTPEGPIIDRFQSAQWLQDLAELEMLLMIGAEMKSGAPNSDG
ncbi:hypothetical protein CC2G_004402 [Coprinopsis cinerea AmutBmut pab1-1]|nr:hypothetical protein CC2G_004402 [Coprinopsis cinerea AmutBmut pab1-1]